MNPDHESQSGRATDPNNGSLEPSADSTNLLPDSASVVPNDASPVSSGLQAGPFDEAEGVEDAKPLPDSSSQPATMEPNLDEGPPCAADTSLNTLAPLAAALASLADGRPPESVESNRNEALATPLWAGKACIVIIVAGLLCHGLLLLTDYRLWDGWSYAHWLTTPGQLGNIKQLFHEIGRPLDMLYWLPLVGVDHIHIWAKVLGVAAWVVAACAVYVVMARGALLPAAQALSIALFTVALPFFDVLGELSIWMNTAALMLFWVAWVVFLRSRHVERLRLASRVAALLLFFLALNLNSLIPFYLAFGVVLALIRWRELSLRELATRALGAARAYPDFIALPFVFWAWKRTFTPNSGYYLGYNVPSLDPGRLMSGWHYFWQAFVELEFTVLFASYAAFMTAVLAACAVAVVIARTKWLRGWLGSVRRMDGPLLILCGCILTAAAAFPYIVVGQNFSAGGWLSRNCILFPFTIGLALTGGLLTTARVLLPARPRAWLVVLAALVVLCAASNSRNYLAFQAMGAKHQSVVEKVEADLAGKQLSVLQLRDYFQMRGTTAFYPSIIWTHMFSQGEETPSMFVLDTGALVPDRQVKDKDGQVQTLVPMMMLTDDILDYELQATTMPYALQGIVHGGAQGVASIYPGKLGEDAVRLGAACLIRRWFAPSLLPEFLSALTEVRFVEVPRRPHGAQSQ